MDEQEIQQLMNPTIVDPKLLEFTSKIIRPETESLSLEKNTKGYNFSIKILSTDVKRLFEIEQDIRFKIAKIQQENSQ